jgi:hypothetical protein
MTEIKENALQIALDFDLEAFWEKHINAQENASQKDIEFEGGVKTALEKDSPAAKFWGTGQTTNRLILKFKRLPPEKAKALKVEVEKEFGELKEIALSHATILKNPTPILKKKVAENLKDLNMNWLEELAGGFMKNYSEYPEATVRVLAQVQFIQWASEMMETKNSTAAPPTSQQPMPKLTWKKKDNALYYLFAEMKDKKIIEGTWEDIARLFQIAFVGFDEKPISSMVRMMGERVRPKSSVSDEIEHILKQTDKEG